MTLDQIVVLEAIVASGGFRAASDKLHRAQSAVSYAIKTLEGEIGFELFDRSGHTPKLSTKGGAFLEKARRLLKESSDLEAWALTLKSGQEPTINFSVSSIMNMELLTPILCQFQRKFPATKLNLRQEILSGEQLLQSAEVDLALAENPEHIEQYESKEIAHVEMPILVKSNHPIALIKRDLTPNDVSAYPQIVVSSTYQSAKTAGVFDDAHSWRVTDFSAKRTLILEGLGWGRIPYYLIRDDIERGLLKELHFQGLPKTRVPLFLLRRRGMGPGPVAAWLWDQFSCDE